VRGSARTVLGVGLSVALLWWALRDVSFREVGERIRAADLVLFAGAIAIALAGFWFRAVRWGILLLPIAPGVAFRPRLAATFIGFAVNNVLPARVGEFARAFVLARVTAVRSASAFATLVIERLLDGLVLVALLFVALAAPGFPAAVQVGGIDLRAAAMVFAALAFGITAVLFLAVTWPRRAGQLVHLTARLMPHRFREGFVGLSRSFAYGLAVLRTPRLFGASVALAIGQWLFLALSFLLGFRAFGIDDVPFSGAVFLQSFVSLAVAVPSSPGFFGPFEAASRIGLGLWNVPADQAISFAIGFHIAGYLPVTLIGGYYLWSLKLSWSEVRASEKTVEDEVEHGVDHDGGDGRAGSRPRGRNVRRARP
jgi:glycosyltransferase 2 family protein